jgi:hypothetical protein
MSQIIRLTAKDIHMNIFRSHKKFAGWVAALAIIPVGAFAFFALVGGGSGTGNVETGAQGGFSWTIVISAGTSGPISPVASGTAPTAGERNIVTLTNPTAASQGIHLLTPSMAVDGSGNVKVAGVPKIGCLGSWFSQSVTDAGGLAPVYPVTVAAGQNTPNFRVNTVLIDSGTDQSACASTVPQIVATAS